MGERQRLVLSELMLGNKSWMNKNTGKHFNYQRVEKKCDFCSKVITKKQCNLTHKNYFCNLQCFGKWKIGKASPKDTRQKVNCSNCGSEVLRKKAEIKRSKNFFCSFKCNGEWKSLNLTGPMVYNWKGGYEPYYGDNWRLQRKKVWARDKYSCMRCGKVKEELGKNPDVHHIKPFRLFGIKNYKKANRLSNLISYCNKCHKVEESKLKN